MAITVLEKFPTIFFETMLEKQAAYNVLDEVVSKKDKIKQISSATIDQSTENYATDYNNPIELESFNFVLEGLAELFYTEHKLKFELAEYWVAMYKDAGYHSMHTHSNSIFSGSPNYSGVLYLSNIGGTRLFTDKAYVLESSFTADSEFGKIFCFPSKIVHEYTPNELGNDDRYVVAFNFNLTHEQN